MQIKGVIVTAVQSFFAWRIWVLTKNWFFPALIIATAITGGGQYMLHLRHKSDLISNLFSHCYRYSG